MFLTDGGTEKPKELFDQYNPNKTVCSVSSFVLIFVGICIKYCLMVIYGTMHGNTNSCQPMYFASLLLLSSSFSVFRSLLMVAGINYVKVQATSRSLGALTFYLMLP